MSSGLRGTADDRPPETPSEPPPLAPLQRDHFVANVDTSLRVIAFVAAAGLTGIAGWALASAWRRIADGLAGREPMDISAIATVLLLIAVLLPAIHRLWRSVRHGVKPKLDAAEIAAIESRTFLEAVERHDRLLEAQRLAAEEVGGVLKAERRSEGRDSRLDEPTDRGYEARSAARMKERGDPG
jgi:hypothetical protein